MGKHELLDEHFVEIAGYPNYVVSNYGRVVNIQSKKDVKASSANHTDHLYVTLSRSNVRKTYALRVLVAKAFFVDYKSGIEVYLLSTNYSDCSVTNITLVQPDPEPNIEIVETGEQFVNASAVARRIGGTSSVVLKCLMGMGKTHKGYTFRYVQVE